MVIGGAEWKPEAWPVGVAKDLKKYLDGLEDTEEPLLKNADKEEEWFRVVVWHATQMWVETVRSQPGKNAPQDPYELVQAMLESGGLKGKGKARYAEAIEAIRSGAIQMETGEVIDMPI